MEYLVVEFNQEKFKEFLSSGSASPKVMRQYYKVSFETHSPISSEITPKVAHTTAHNTCSIISEEALKTSSATRAARVNVPQGTRRANALVYKVMVKINLTITLLSELYNSRLSRVLSNPCCSTGMPNVKEGVGHVDNKSKIMQRQSVLQIQNAKFIPAFLSGNARSASNTRPAFYLPQNMRPAFCQF